MLSRGFIVNKKYRRFILIMCQGKHFFLIYSYDLLFVGLKTLIYYNAFTLNMLRVCILSGLMGPLNSAIFRLFFILFAIIWPISSRIPVANKSISFRILELSYQSCFIAFVLSIFVFIIIIVWFLFWR